MKLHIHNSLNDSKPINIFSSKNNAASYGALGVSNGPIKINQKIKIVSSKNTNNNTAQKSQKSQLTTSSQKMKMSKT